MTFCLLNKENYIQATCLFLNIFFITIVGTSQPYSSFEGNWAGELLIAPYDIPIGLDFKEKKGEPYALFHNPAQGASRYQIDSVSLSNPGIRLKFDNIIISLSVSGDTLRGQWKQGDKVNQLLLVKNAVLRQPSRPQNPVPPFPYSEDTLRFHSMDTSIVLEGTWTRTDNEASIAAVFLTGSGPQDRDENILDHRLFAVIADHLSRNDIATFRYDDRGIGQSSGIHSKATSFDFALDAAGAYAQLKALGYEHVGFIGHSEGGMIAQIADSLVRGAAFHIYLAAPGLSISELMVAQNRQVFKSLYPDSLLEGYLSLVDSVFYTIKTNDPIQIKQDRINRMSARFYNLQDEAGKNMLAPNQIIFSVRFTQLLYLDWWNYFIRYEPERYLRQIECPILAFNGEKDIQVMPENLKAIEEYASKSVLVKSVVFPDLNHLFQHCISCSLGEYGLITETFSADVMDQMSSWILSLFNKE